MEKKDVSVSVIVPVYNTARYLKECIESLLAQTLSDIEIILVNDGSTDESGMICDKYAESHENVKVVHQRNKGLVGARKTGFAESCGKYVGFVDSDDWVENTMYETLFLAAEKYGADICMCGRCLEYGAYVRRDFHGRVMAGHYNRERMETDIFPYMIAAGNFFEWCISPTLCDKIFKRELLGKHLMHVDDSIRMGEDAACTYPCIMEAQGIYVLEKYCYHYRRAGISLRAKTACLADMDRFRAFYRCLQEGIGDYAGLYHMSAQIRQYVLFLLLPRLYDTSERIGQLDFLFPYLSVKRGERLVIYGAGEFGTGLYRWLLDSGFCVPVLWVDGNYAQLSKSNVHVKPPEDIAQVEFDHIVVAITIAHARQQVYDGLLARYGAERVAVIDEAWLMSDEAWRLTGMGGMQDVERIQTGI